MKIQCACGTKVAFDVTPEMATTRMQFVCPSCGLDSSNLVNDLIQQELNAVPVVPPPVTDAPVPRPAPKSPRVAEASSLVPAVPESGGAGLRLKSHGNAPTGLPATQVVAGYCSRHPSQKTTETCVVCQKPICPECMEVFGYVCSGFCKGKAELKGIAVPAFQGQRQTAEKRQWRVTGLITAVVSLLLVGGVGVWIWYAWFATVPSPVYSVRFEEVAHSGRSWIGPNDQFVYLHGGTLARCNVKSKQQLWSCDCLDKPQLAAALAAMIKQMKDWGGNMPPEDKLKAELERSAIEQMELHVAGQNIWLVGQKKLRRFDWETGKVVEDFPMPDEWPVTRGDEFIFVSEADSGDAVIRHFSFATGQSREEQVPGVRFPPSAPIATIRPGRTNAADPKVIAAAYQHLSVPEKLAFPATLSEARKQQEAMDQMQDGETWSSRRRHSESLDNRYILIASPQGPIHFSARVLEQKYEERQAMKARPTNSVLNDPGLSAGKSGELANEMLNEMQRERGGATTTENVSRFQVKIRRPATPDVVEWQGEVIGPPRLFPLQTVDVVAGGKSVTVVDKNNKTLWRNDLNYRMGQSYGWWRDGERNPTSGSGPCVERGDTLFIYDDGMLTAFELATGNVRWRVPSVGITGLFFDDEGKVYVNTTTATPDKLRFSNQIDVRHSDHDVLMKIDPATGAVLWSVEPGGPVVYVSGKFIYLLKYYQPPEQQFATPDTGLETPPYMTIRRINPKNGKMMWEHDQERAPVDVQFDKNTITCVFRKEVQVLKYLSF